MNICTVCNSRSLSLTEFLSTMPDEKLGFVEGVCGLLTESRFKSGFAEPWDLNISRFSIRNSIERITGIQHTCWLDDDDVDLYPPNGGRRYIPRDIGSNLSEFERPSQISSANLADRVANSVAVESKYPATQLPLARGSPDIVQYKSLNLSVFLRRIAGSEPGAIATGLLCRYHYSC